MTITPNLTDEEARVLGDVMTDGGSELGLDLCVAMCGEYRCEGFMGHDGPHFALGGDIEWKGDLVSRTLRMEAEQDA